MIDVHVHAVPPNLPGVGQLSPLLRMSPETVATELRRHMQTAGATHALAMGQWNVGEDDPLGVNKTLRIAELVPGLKAIGVMDPTLSNGQFFNPTDADFRALELMGYTVTPVPEPAAVAGIAAFGLVAGRRLRRRIPDAPALAG